MNRCSSEKRPMHSRIFPRNHGGRPFRLRRGIWLIAICAGLLGCEPPDPTGLDDESNLDVSGVWVFSASGIGAGKFSSASSSITSALNLGQNGGNVTGSHQNTISTTNFCSDIMGCFTAAETIPSGPVEGTVKGNRVVLRFNTDSESDLETYEGTVNGDRMEGDGWSASRSAPPAPPKAAPAAPTNLTATINTQAFEALLQWKDNSNDEDGFAIAERCAGTSTWSVLGLVDAGSTAVSITGFQSGMTCSYVVFAFRIDGEDAVISGLSNEVTVGFP